MKYVGSNTARQMIGFPGHCDQCVEWGHVDAHPHLGCSDVGCYEAHTETAPAATKLKDVDSTDLVESVAKDVYEKSIPHGVNPEERPSWDELGAFYRYQLREMVLPVVTATLAKLAALGVE